MTRIHGIEITPPFNFTKVRLGIGGRHYHQPNCPASDPGTTLRMSKDYVSDYAEIEIPGKLIELRSSILYLGRKYIPCPMCMFPQRKAK